MALLNQRDCFKRVWETREHQCEDCGKPLHEAKVHMFHHRVKRSQGGKHTPENIRLVCYACHSAYHGTRAQGSEWMD